jgi:hypothetical protein
MRWIYTMKTKIPTIEIPDNVKKLLEEAEKSIEEYRLPLAIFSDPAP